MKKMNNARIHAKNTVEQAEAGQNGILRGAPHQHAQPVNLKVFENPEFGAVRIVEIDGEPWLVGKDVAAALGYERPTKAISDKVDAEDRIMVDGETQSQFGIELGQRGGWLINESGLYSLVLSSKLPGAKKFRRWVTSEVLPSIRKHGGYIAGQEAMSDEELLARALLMAQSKINERDRQIAELNAKAELDAPKVAFADAVMELKGDITGEKFTSWKRKAIILWV